jgi:hypothetical protein
LANLRWCTWNNILSNTHLLSAQAILVSAGRAARPTGDSLFRRGHEMNTLTNIVNKFTRRLVEEIDPDNPMKESSGSL